MIKYFIFLVFVLSSCQSARQEDDHPKGRVIGEIKRKATEAIVKKYGFPCVGGGAEAMDEIRALHIAFQVRRVLQKEEGRRLLVDCVEELAAAANSHPELKNYFLDDKFGPEHAEITLFTCQPDGKEVYFPDIAVFSARMGYIRYRTVDKENPNGYWTREDETFPQAMAILEAEKLNLFDLNSTAAKVERD